MLWTVLVTVKLISFVFDMHENEPHNPPENNEKQLQFCMKALTKVLMCVPSL